MYLVRRLLLPLCAWFLAAPDAELRCQMPELVETHCADCHSGEDPAGNYVYYGVREFAMSAIMNGLALHGGFIPYGGTFLVFSDYARNAVRMSALMGLGVVYVYTHDSIGLGEDGLPVVRLSSGAAGRPARESLHADLEALLR